MSIQRYNTIHPDAYTPGIIKEPDGEYALYTDCLADKQAALDAQEKAHQAELHNLLSTIADIRAALGVGDKPMLSELAGIVREVRDQAVHGGVKIAEWRHKASIFRLAMVWWRNRCRSHNERREAMRRACAGHLGIVESVAFSFGVAGVSRALSHQLVRQRMASFCQQSQRYVKANGFDYLIPPSIENDPVAREWFVQHMKSAAHLYKRLTGQAGIPAEDARFVLPNACETKLVVTMNARSLLHFFEQRCCMRAQWEIRALANEMLRLCKEAVPVLFETAGARCERVGFCEEEKCCGRYPKLKDVMEMYRKTCNG